MIYRAFHPPLFRFLRFQEPSEAEDLAATVWMTVARTLPGFEGDERAFRAWMFTIAGASVLAGILIYVISERTRHGKSDVQILADTRTTVSAGDGGVG